MAKEASPLRVAVADAEPTEPVALVLEECASAYGRDLLAYLLGAGAEAPLSSWRLDEKAAEAGWSRLRLCYRVLQVFKEPRRARAWMRTTSPRFGGQTPAWAIRSGDPDLLAVVEHELDCRA
jgi:hypothetical protein